MLPIADGVRLLDDTGPGAGRGAGDDRAIWTICGYDLELGAVAAVEDGAVIDDFGVWVDCGEISSAHISVLEAGVGDA